MNNEDDKMSALETIAMVIFYILLFPIMLVFGVLFVVSAAVVAVFYLLVELVAWPITEIVKSHKQKKKEKDIVVSIPEKIDRHLEDDANV